MLLTHCQFQKSKDRTLDDCTLSVMKLAFCVILNLDIHTAKGLP